MRKDLGDKMQFMPLPVLMLATYDQDGKANVMNAAWGGVYDYNQVYVSLSKHKTTDNFSRARSGFPTHAKMRRYIRDNESEKKQGYLLRRKNSLLYDLTQRYYTT